MYFRAPHAEDVELGQATSLLMEEPSLSGEHDAHHGDNVNRGEQPAGHYHAAQDAPASETSRDAPASEMGLSISTGDGSNHFQPISNIESRSRGGRTPRLTPRHTPDHRRPHPFELAHESYEELHRAAHNESHLLHRSGWLRAMVLGANDGIVSTAALILTVIAAELPKRNIITAGAGGLVSGALSMALGEYVSVCSQADVEQADIAMERAEHVANPLYELEELTRIYEGRGLAHELARTVAEKLMDADSLGAHMRDELGLSEATRARPMQAALSSCAAFACGAAVPLVSAIVVPDRNMKLQLPVVSVVSLLSLAALGLVSAWLGGARTVRALVRVVVGGILAMAIATGVGFLLGGAP
eukprot:jgi/Mesvir1/4647/Mv03463-RA.1